VPLREPNPPITPSHHVTIYAADLWDGAMV
jgi:hypothetical protein